ncbi:hypothetical protein NBRC111894_2547 [Sporolactobacillus inulinus]|uniref:Uncharacterized protein n=1 Tax=Sporolactobacillus inulinus TaxID=2078 RepID=A0A4Y1ZDD9_9BACL|nr:hypothetical protein NBRC111894_2547 [Sporolactobacillus inulinus]
MISRFSLSSLSFFVACCLIAAEQKPLYFTSAAARGYYDE